MIMMMIMGRGFVSLEVWVSRELKNVIKDFPLAEELPGCHLWVFIFYFLFSLVFLKDIVSASHCDLEGSLGRQLASSTGLWRRSEIWYRLQVGRESMQFPYLLRYLNRNSMLDSKSKIKCCFQTVHSLPMCYWHYFGWGALSMKGREREGERERGMTGSHENAVRISYKM